MDDRVGPVSRFQVRPSHLSFPAGVQVSRAQANPIFALVLHSPGYVAPFGL